MGGTGLGQGTLRSRILVAAERAELERYRPVARAVANNVAPAHGLDQPLAEALAELALVKAIRQCRAWDIHGFELYAHAGYWLDLEAIPATVGVLSSGERAYLLIAASILLIAASIGLDGSDGDSVTVNLSDALLSLGRQQLDLVLAAVAHASGSHLDNDVIVDENRVASFVRLSSLYPWPEQS